MSWARCERCGLTQRNGLSRDDRPAGCAGCGHLYAVSASGPAQRPGANGRRKKRRK